MNWLRTLIITFVLLALVAGGLPPLEGSLAKWGHRASVGKRKKHRAHRRHSRAWWRRQRAQARLRRERAMRRRLMRLAEQRGNTPDTPAPASAFILPSGKLPPAPSGQFPFDFTPPQAWVVSRRSASGETAFNVGAPDGRPLGKAVITQVSLSGADVAAAPASPKTVTVGGFPVTALRRTVIDRMVAAGGWVTNDMVRDIQGRRVFVVLAQEGAPGSPSLSRTFYFIEIDGRVYCLATSVPVEFAAPVAAGSEQLMASLRPARGRNVASQK